MDDQLTKNLRALRLLVAIAILLAGTNAYAETKTQSLEVLTETAKQFLASHLHDSQGDEILIEVNKLDPRVRLKYCEGEIEAFWPYEPRNLKNVSVGVRCLGATPWKVYLQGKTKRMRTIAVLNTPVDAGQPLEKSMLSMRKLDVLSLRSGGIEDYSTFLGRQFKKSVRAGTPLSTGILAIPKLVHRREFVKIRSGSGGIAVYAEGEALSDGHHGDIIKVRNKTSGKVLQATVIDQGTVRVNH